MKAGQMRANNLFTIAPHAPFLKILAKNVCNGRLLNGWDLSSPFALSDVTIILPTMRARYALAREFANLLGGTTLLPDIRTFGGQSEEEEPFLPPFDEPNLLPPISPIKRRLLIASLVEKWKKQNSERDKISANEILALSDSLGELIDSFHIEQIDSNNIKNIAPENLSAYWQETLKFLSIAFEAWPKILKEFGQIDASELRNQQLRRHAKALKQIYGERPVIAAGSTGSIPATANLLKAISKLKRGAIILPALDTSLNKENIKALIDETKNPHTHPQYGLARLLARLGELPESFIELAPKAKNKRPKIVQNAFALVQDTKDWAIKRRELADEIAKSFENLSIINAKNDEEQARAIALCALDGVIRKKSVGIISPDRNLARRIISELNRFDIEIDDSAGTPLFQTGGGRLVRQILALIINNFGAIHLIALLNNPNFTLDYNREKIGEIAALLDNFILRGKMLGEGIEQIKQFVQNNVDGRDKYTNNRLSQEQAEEIILFLDKLAKSLAPLLDLFAKEKFYISDYGLALEETIIAIIGNKKLKNNAQITPIFNWLEQLKQAKNLGPAITKSEIEKATIALMAQINVRQHKSHIPNVSIWGLLEARLQNCDIMILAGLNETIWPQIADPGPWLSRNMAISAKLEPPERRIGQAAHDFVCALGNENVIIAQSENIGTAPSQKSRFLSRLIAFIGEEQAKICAQKGQVWLKQAQAIDYVSEPKPATRPTPKPPQNMRPKSLSITEIEKLIRSPYDIYAKYVLRLKKLDPLSQEPGAREKGNIIHAIFERYIKEKIDVNKDDALEKLLIIAKEEFSILNSMPEREIIWFERFREMAQKFIEYEKWQSPKIKQSFAEISAKWGFDVEGEQFILRGKVDRIDILNDNSAQIIDYKTGNLPSNQNMKNFLAPQLLLEGLMLKEGAFEQISVKNISALKYIKLGSRPNIFEVKNFVLEKDKQLDDYIDEIMQRLSRQVSALLLSDKYSMAAHILPNPEQKYSWDYDHLARIGEWALIEGEEE